VKALTIIALVAGCADRTLSEPQPWRCPDGVLAGSIVDGECLDEAGLGGPTQFAYDCSVSDVARFGMADQTEHVLPMCDDDVTPTSSTNKPCWIIEMDLQTCATGSQTRFRIERSEALSPETTVVSYCEACKGP
jgi:hypothetical protein